MSDNDAVKAAVDKLNTTSAPPWVRPCTPRPRPPAGSRRPSAERPSATGGSDGSSAGSDDDVVDAEIVDDDQNTSEAK